MAEQLYSQIGEFTPDNLIAGQEIPVLVKEVKAAKGQGTLLRGTVIGINASGLAFPVDKSKADGTQTAFGILTDTIDTAQDTDVITTCYVSGLFNSLALTFGGTDVAADHEAKLRELGIYLKENVKY